jgi:DNA-binding transcriptional MerR regulator
MTMQHRPADRAQPLSSGEVASAAGVNLQTLRYYERRGLLAQPNRGTSGHRQYPPHTVTLLRMIKNAQRLGLSLDEITSVITDRDSNRISTIAERKVAEIDTQIARLTATRDALASYIR